MEDILLEPLKAYSDNYKNTFDENAEAYFDDLVNKSGIDAEQNRATVAKYKRELAAVKKIENEQSKLRAIRGLMIFLIIAGIIVTAVGVYKLATGGDLLWLISLVGLAAVGVPIWAIVSVINPKLKLHDEQKSKHEKSANEYLEEAKEQMRPLNELFDSDITRKLIEKTVPKIDLDDNFDMRRFDYLQGKYGFGENDDDDCSTTEILSGEILGNPFIVEREFAREMGSKTYTGSIVITWSTTYTDSNGNTRTQHHSQTLFANVTKPCPYFNEQTRLIYGNEAAPSLCFTHEPSHAEKYSDDELERKVNRGARKIRKKQRKAVSSGSDFTEMGNDDFDVLFGALDRNDEVQFRLLFTPLAQKNMLELMTSRESFGDDFYFYKRNCINCISSEHSADWDLDTNYKRYCSYDVDDSRKKFLSFNRQYFKSLYFDLAPLLAIPLYQQHKPHEYIYQTEYSRNYTSYEAECAVNNLGYRNFAPEEASTPSILKTRLLGKDGKTDKVAVRASAYVTEDRVEFVTVFGGDGRFHAVPVHWTEYIPVEKTSVVTIKQLEMTDRQFNENSRKDSFADVLNSRGSAVNFYHKLMCCLLRDDYDGESFDSVIDGALR